MIKKFRKKPVVIEAIKWDGKTETLEVLNNEFGIDPLHVAVGKKDEEDKIKIETLEGTMLACIGDYIIKGVNGEFYPCKPDIFEKTYEEVTDES